MHKPCLLLLFSIALFQASSQPGSLDPTFGNKGIQTTAFFNINLLDEQGKIVLTNANGDIFVVALIENTGNTRIAKYLPNGKLDSSYGTTGYSTPEVGLYVTGAVLQGNKIITAGNSNSNIVFARFTADGLPDSSFGVNGKVTTDLNNPYNEAFPIALQGDKILVAGYTLVDGGNIGSYPVFALDRYTADGILDSTFLNGTVITDLEGIAKAIALQDDKILVAGSFNNANALVRYTANGALDASFGKNGKAITDVEVIANGIALQGSKIILAGSDFALSRYKANGRLDSSFGKNGKATTHFSSSDNQAYSIILQGKKIIVGGFTYDSATNYDFALVRYTANGRLDTAFGKKGKAITDFNSSDDQAYSIALQGNKLIVEGGTYNSVATNTDFALARYTANGALDKSFGVNGKLTEHFPASWAYFTSTVIQGNSIIAAGYTTNDNNNYDFALARYITDGSLDASFGVKGIVATDFNSTDDVVNAIALQGDKIVAAGFSLNPVNNTLDLALTRYTADGKLDSFFGVKGKVITDFNSTDDVVNAIALQGDKIVVAGYSINPVNNTLDIALARYTSDGSLDASFGKNGKVITDFNGYNDEARSIALQADKIIVAGTSNDDFALVRYNADGSLDDSFGKKGKVTTDFNNTFDGAEAIALQGDKIILAGRSIDTLGAMDFALDRYTANGSLDSSFGVNGKVTTDFGSPDDQANTIALQDDKIIVAGYTISAYADFALARYATNGTLDSSFGVNGEVITDFSGSSSINAIALHENRLYAVGGLGSSSGDMYGVVAAYQLEAAEPAISIADVIVSESKAQAVVAVSLSKPATRTVRVHFTTRNKTAVSPQDYYSVKGTLQFAAGITTAKIKIPIVNDSIHETAEQFEVLLTNARNASIKDSIGVVTIKDDDKVPAINGNNTLITKQANSLNIQASPNPSAETFTIQLHSTDLKQKVSIRVYDISGRLIEQKEPISIGQSLRLGDQYKPGTYIIEAVQGRRSVQTKVIKAGK